MKRIIAILLSVMLLVSCTASAFAATEITFTPDDVVESLENNNDLAEDVVWQTAYGTYAVTEMLMYITKINANDEQLEILGEIMDTLTNLISNTDELSSNQSLAGGSDTIVRTLQVLAQEVDPQGIHNDQLQAYIDKYYANDAAAETADEQTIIAICSATELAGLIVMENCTSQDQLDQVQDTLQNEYGAEFDSTQNMEEQLAVGTKWLRKLMGAFVKLMNPNIAEDMDAHFENTESVIASHDDYGPVQTACAYLNSTVYALKMFTDTLNN